MSKLLLQKSVLCPQNSKCHWIALQGHTLRVAWDRSHMSRIRSWLRSRGSRRRDNRRHARGRLLGRQVRMHHHRLLPGMRQPRILWRRPREGPHSGPPSDFLSRMDSGPPQFPTTNNSEYPWGRQCKEVRVSWGDCSQMGPWCNIRLIFIWIIVKGYVKINSNPTQNLSAPLFDFCDNHYHLSKKS